MEHSRFAKSVHPWKAWEPTDSADGRETEDIRVPLKAYFGSAERTGKLKSPTRFVPLLKADSPREVRAESVVGEKVRSFEHHEKTIRPMVSIASETTTLVRFVCPWKALP